MMVFMEAKRTKILFLITKSSWGGAQRYVFDLANNLPSDQFEVAVATGGDGALIDKLDHAGLKVHRLKSLKRDISFFNEVQAFFALWNIVRKERPDVLHVNSSKAGALGAFIGRLCRVPKIIFTAHGWAFNEDRPHWQKVLLKAIHWMTIMLSHKTIAVSEGMKKEMDWLGVQKKMEVIHLGRTVSDMRYKDEARGMLEMKVIDTTARLIDYHSDFWIGTIAELHPIKRINRAINAVSALVKDFPSLRFIIIHDGELKAELQQQVKDLGLQEHVFFTGMLEDAARLLPAFDLFVLPSKSEAFGYVLIEAGAASVPVVATEVGGIPDIITNGENGLLVPPDDTPALTQAIRTLISNDDLRHSLARAHYEKSKTFTVEKMVEKTMAAYRQN
jgi:glycosyltransferase involved in cell wall biosynthesis